MVKAGHVAVMVELLDGNELPGGKGQIEYAQGIVKERFAQSNVLFGIDQLLKGVIRAITRAGRRFSLDPADPRLGRVDEIRAHVPEGRRWPYRRSDPLPIPCVSAPITRGKQAVMVWCFMARTLKQCLAMPHGSR